MAELPTVKIKSDHPDHNGFIVINASDFDPMAHDEYLEPGILAPVEPKRRGRPPRLLVEST